MNKPLKKTIIAFFVSILFLLIVFHDINYEKLINTFSLIDRKILLLVLPVILIEFCLRGLRWKILLPDNSISAFHLSSLYTIGSALNIFLPARSGDLYRAYKAGKYNQDSKLKAFGSIVAERICDGLTVLGFLLIGMNFIQTEIWINKIALTASVVFLSSLIICLILLKINNLQIKNQYIQNIFKKIDKNKHQHIYNFIENSITSIKNLIDGFSGLNKPLNVCKIIIFSILIWISECIISYIFVYSFYPKISVLTALFITSFTALSTVIPSSSIYVGPIQYAYVLALSIFSVEKSNALAIAFTQQSVTLIIISTLAIIFYLITNKDKMNINN